MGIAIVKLDSFKRAFQGILEVQAGAVHNYEKDGDIPRMHFQCQLKISKGDTRSLKVPLQRIFRPFFFWLR